MRHPSFLKGWVGACLTGLVFSARPAFAGDNSCKGLSEVKATQLLALPESALPEFTGSCTTPPPGVSCDSTAYGPTSKICDQKLTVTQDHVVGDTRRIIATHSSPSRPWRSGPWPSDGVYVFGCEGGQISALSGYCRPESEAKAGYENVLLNCSQRYDCGDPFGPEASPSQDALSVSCKTLQTKPASDLVAIPGYAECNVFGDGLGCQKLEEDQEGCTWMAGVREDRALSGGRRLIIVNRACESCTSDDDYVFVFSCVSGRVRKVFNDSFGAGVEIVDATGDNLTLSASDWRERDPHCCPSGIRVMKFVWDKKLQNYVLRGLQFKKLSGSR